jgi:hypothetical protein
MTPRGVRCGSLKTTTENGGYDQDRTKAMEWVISQQTGPGK